MSRVSASRRRGTTLVELLISVGLFLFVLGMVYSSLQMGLQAYRRTERFATLQQQAMRGIRNVAEDLSGAPRDGVRLAPGAALLLSARRGDGVVTFDSGGRTLWQGWVTYRLESGGLVRRETPITPTATIPSPVPTLSQVLMMPAGEERVVAHDISVLDFELGASAGIRLTATQGDPADLTLVTLLDRVYFRQ